MRSSILAAVAVVLFLVVNAFVPLSSFGWTWLALAAGGAVLSDVLRARRLAAAEVLARREIS